METKNTILQYEEQALNYQQELVIYKRDTEAKILQLQAKYNEEISRVKYEKQLAISEFTKRIQEAQEKRNLFNKPDDNFKLKVETPNECSRSFTVLRQDTGSTGPKIIKHRRQHSDNR